MKKPLIKPLVALRTVPHTLGNIKAWSVVFAGLTTPISDYDEAQEWARHLATEALLAGNVLQDRNRRWLAIGADPKAIEKFRRK